MQKEYSLYKERGNSVFESLHDRSLSVIWEKLRAAWNLY